MINLVSKYFKKSMTMLLIVAMLTSSLAVLTACSSNSDSKDKEYTAKDIKVAVMKGPTGIGMVKLMKDDKDEKARNNYDFTIAASADEFTSLLVKGDIQVAALPCNAAATLYNKSAGKIKVIGVNTLGVLYVLENKQTESSVKTVSDLKGRTVYMTGKGTTPEYTMRYLLKCAGLDPDKDVKLEFKSEATEVVATMQKSSDSQAVCMLPQPYVSTVIMNNNNIQVALDVTKEWERLNGNKSTVVTGVIAVNSQYYENNKEAIECFMEEYKASVEYVNTYVVPSSLLVEEFGLFKASVAKNAIPQCNITLVTGEDMKNKVEGYLKVLFDENASAVGGSMPAKDFYITD